MDIFALAKQILKSHADTNSVITIDLVSIAEGNGKTITRTRILQSALQWSKIRNLEEINAINDILHKTTELGQGETMVPRE